MELADLRNPRESYDEDELFDGVRSPGWEPDSKIILQLEMSQKVTIFNTVLPFINLILLLQLYNSHPGPTTQSLFLALTICVFVSACSIVWVYHCSDRIQYSLRPNLNATGLICLATGILGVYFLGLFMRLIFYQDEHLAYLKGQLASPEIWKKFYGEHTFEQESALQKSKLNWSVPSSLFLSISQLMISYTARKIYLTFSMRTYGLNKLLLIMCGLFTMVLCWETFYWARQANIVSSTLLLGLNMKKSAIGMLTLSFLLMLVVTANVFLAVRKHKKSYIVLAVVYFCAYILGALCTFQAISQVRKYHIQQDVSLRNCKDLAISVHEEKLRALCPFGDKYLAPGVRCGKDELTIRWEAGLENHEVRTLNPSCCEMARYYYINPQTQLSHLGIMISILLIVLILINLSLWRNSNSLFYIFPKLWENVGLLAVVGLLVSFFVYLAFQSQHKPVHKHNTEMLSYSSPAMFPSPGFTLVPPDLSEKFRGQLCFNNNMELYPFPKPDANLERGKPVMRVAIMALSAYAKMKHNKDNKVGPKNSSSIFFPGCEAELKTHNLSSFKVIFGPTNQVRDSLANAIFCTSSMLKDNARIYYNVTFWGPDQLDKNGLTHRENQVLQEPLKTDNQSCSLGYSHFFPAKYGDRTSIKGRLAYIDPTSNKTSGVHAGIQIRAFEVLNNDQVLPINQSNSVILKDSIFIVTDIIRLYAFDSTIRLEFTDPQGVYLNKTVDLLIPKTESGTLELSAGVVRLLTKDGNRCDLDDIICKSKSMTLTGIIKIAPTNSSSKRRAYAGAQILLYKDFQITNQPMLKISWKNSTWESDPLPYGSYTVVVLRKKYLPRIEKIDLQSPTMPPILVNLRRSYGNHQMTIISEVLDQAVDLDLLVVIKGSGDRECTISPYNKYCAYGKIFTKSKDSRHRKDAVILKNMAVATYAAYTAPAPSYTKSCKSDMYELASGNSIIRNDILPSWNWHAIQGARPLSSVAIVGHFKYNDDFDPNDSLIWPKLRNSLALEEAVETLEQSKKPRIILSSFPRKINTTSTLTPYLVDTDVRYSLQNKGLLDLAKLRNWNVVASATLNSQDEAWESFNFSKILNDSVLNDHTIWPELENKTMMVMSWNNTTPTVLRYNQTLPNGQNSSITESNATKQPNNTTGQWMNQLHTFRNETNFTNNTTLVSLRWWNAMIDPKDQHVVSNSSESSEDLTRPGKGLHHHRKFISFESPEPHKELRRLHEVTEDTASNKTAHSSVSKIFERDTRANITKRTVVNCKDLRNGIFSVQKNCTSDISNLTSISNYKSVSVANVSQNFNQTLLEMVEKYTTSPLIMKLNSTYISKRVKPHVVTQSTLRRKEEIETNLNKVLLVENYMSVVNLDDLKGSKNLTVKESGYRYFQNDVAKVIKSENTTIMNHGSLTDTKIHFWENKTAENQSVVITTKVDNAIHFSPTVDSKQTKKVVKNKDVVHKVSLQSVTVSSEVLNKQSGFKKNYTMNEETIASKKGQSEFVTATKTRIDQLFEPGTNVTKSKSNSTATAKRSHQGGVWQTDHSKSEYNQSRSLPPVIGPINSTVIQELDQTPWNQVDTTIQAKKVCPKTKASCYVDLKGSNHNTTSTFVYSSADLVLSKSKNAKDNTVLSQSLILKQGNDPKKAAWDMSILLDQIIKPNQELVQETNLVNLNLWFSINNSLADLVPQNSSQHFFGNSSTFNRAHVSKHKVYSRNYTESKLKKWTRSLEYGAHSWGKINNESYLGEINMTHVEEQLTNGSHITNHTFSNVSEGRAVEGFMIDIFNMTGARLKSNFTFLMNTTNNSAISMAVQKLSQMIRYLNSTNIEDHSVFTKIESAETIEIADSATLYQETRQVRKSIIYKANNLESEVLTNHSIQKNKKNETDTHTFTVLVNSIDLNKQPTDPQYKKQVSIYEKSFLILPSGKLQVLKEHVFPEDLIKAPPLLPQIPTLVMPETIPLVIPADASNFQVRIFDIEGVDLSLVKNPESLGLKPRKQTTRKLQLMNFADTAIITAHQRTPRAAADARLRKINQRLKTPSPTFSKNSVDHIYGVDKSQFFLIGCFTGYGAPSVLQLNEYTVDRPTPAECQSRLAKSPKKRYMVENLLEEIKEYEEGHPEYVDLRTPGARTLFEADSIDQLEIADFNIESY